MLKKVIHTSLILSITFMSFSSVIAQSTNSNTGFETETSFSKTNEPIELTKLPFAHELNEDELANIEGKDGGLTAAIVVGVAAGVVAGVISSEVIQPRIEKYKENREKQREENKSKCRANGGTPTSRGCR